MSKETEREKKARANLTPRQATFVQEYLKTNNITQSAITAGYSPKTAGIQGSKLLCTTKIRNYLDAINERLESARIADIQEVMEYLTSVMRGEVKDQFDMDTSVQDRTRAAGELAKRLDVRMRSLHIEGAVQIVNDIPEVLEEDLEE